MIFVFPRHLRVLWPQRHVTSLLQFRRMPATGAALAIAMLLLSVSATGQLSTGRVFFLDIRGGRVVSAALDGSDLRVLASGRSGIPDGIAVDVEQRQVFWSIMGRPRDDDGLIEGAALDGGEVTIVVPAGGTFTPKQLRLDPPRPRLHESASSRGSLCHVMIATQWTARRQSVSDVPSCSSDRGPHRES